MKYLLIRCIKFLLSILDLLIPRDKKLWAFYVTPNTSWDANMQCIYALSLQEKDVRCFLSFLPPTPPPDNIAGKSVSFLSLSGLWSTLRAGVIIFDHALPPGMTRYRRQCVNLWHGIPIKQIRFFCPENFPAGYLKQQSRNTTLLISSSKTDQLAMSAAFQIPPERVKITGLPRNDLLITPKPFLRVLPSLAEEDNKINELKRERKLILYAPTYRDKGMENFVRPFNDAETSELLTVLEKHNAVLGIRDHIFSSGSCSHSLQDNDLIIELPSSSYSNTNLLLASVDLLITDYSSIWVDYLLLKRPIIGFCPDLDDYLELRGFLYDFQSTFPGPLTRTTQELVQQLDTVLSRGKFTVPEKQRTLYRFFHQYCDGQNSKRVLKAIRSNPSPTPIPSPCDMHHG